MYWEPAEVVAALIGGIFIGISSTLNLFFYGRITGMSGTFNSIVKFDKSNGFFWKFCLFAGLILIPNLIFIFGNNTINVGDH